MDRSGQPRHLDPVLRAGLGDVQGEDMTEDVDGEMQLGALLALGPGSGSDGIENVNEVIRMELD